MQKIKIDRVDAESIQAPLASLGQFRSRRVVRICLGNDEYIIAVTIDCVCDDFFRAAFAVHFGGIDQRHAELDSQTQRRDFIRVGTLLFAHAPRALTEDRNARAIGQFDSFHCDAVFQSYFAHEQSDALLAITRRVKIAKLDNVAKLF